MTTPTHHVISVHTTLIAASFPPSHGQRKIFNSSVIVEHFEYNTQVYIKKE